MIDKRNLFNRPIKNYVKTYNNIRKSVTGQGDDQTTGCLLNYTYFKIYYKLIAIHLRKQQKLDNDPKERQQINFIGNLTGTGGARMHFIIEEAGETVLELSKGTVKSITILFCFNKILK